MSSIQSLVEEKVKSFREAEYDKFIGAITSRTEYTEWASKWWESALADLLSKQRTEMVGSIGAKLLARHSPQIVLDAYFDVANEELEQ